MLNLKGYVLGRFLVHEGVFYTRTVYELIVHKDFVNPLKGQRLVVGHMRENAQVESKARACLYMLAWSGFLNLRARRFQLAANLGPREVAIISVSGSVSLY